MARTYQSGDVVVVTLPLTVGPGDKARPAVVLLDTEDNDVIVVPTTSQGARTDFDVEIQDLQRAGLTTISWARVNKPQTVHKGLISKRTGRLATPDWQRVRAKAEEVNGLIK